MFSLTIVDSDDFLDMPVSARELYFQFGMRADDDGFVNPKRVMRLTRSTDDDLRLLIAKGYVINFDNQILVLRDWKINNLIRPDRYVQTLYQNYLEKLFLNDSGQYELKLATEAECLPLVCIGKDRIGKVSSSTTTEEKNIFKLLKVNNPTNDQISLLQGKIYYYGFKAVENTAEKIEAWLIDKNKQSTNPLLRLTNWLKKDYPNIEPPRVFEKIDDSNYQPNVKKYEPKISTENN